MLTYERQRWNEAYACVAGVDEAGRGPLAGPVVAAAVVLERSFAEAEEHGVLGGITDSKKLSPARREKYCRVLRESDHVDLGVGFASHHEVDRLNVLRATELAMVRAVAGLSEPPSFVLVDGRPVGGFPVPSQAIVGGDRLSLSIAAASIVAKVSRDSWMCELDRRYPRYGFARHKGYGSRAHIQALFEFGPCPVHRLSFRPVREAAELQRRMGEGRENGR